MTVGLRLRQSSAAQIDLQRGEHAIGEGQGRVALVPPLHERLAERARLDVNVSLDAVLDAVVAQLRLDGVRLGGLRQCSGARGPCGRIVVERLDNGARHDLTRPRGRLARGCLLDEAALVALLPSLAAEIDGDDPELFVLNCFGVREAEGRGACSLIEAALLADLPLLTVARDAHLGRWQETTTARS